MHIIMQNYYIQKKSRNCSDNKTVLYIRLLLKYIGNNLSRWWVSSCVSCFFCVVVLADVPHYEEVSGPNE